MLFVANYTLKGPLQAWIAISLLSALTVFFSPFGVLLGAAIALITLRVEISEGVKATVLASILTLGLNMAITQTYWPGVLALVEFVLPVFFLAVLLRQTNDLSKVLAATALLAGLGVLLFHLVVGDAEAWWLAFFQQDLMPMLEQAGMQQDLAATFSQVAEIITLLIAMMAVVLWYSMLLIARWWQGTLFYPGQFKTDFYQLKLPKNLAVLAAAVAVAGLLVDLSLLQSLTSVLMAAFMFQGVSILHHAVDKKEMSSAWLVGMYVFLFLFPQTILILATIGLMDTWIDVRSRWTND